MPRSYRYSLIAIFGWLTLVGAGEPPKSQAAPKENKEHSETNKSLQEISAALQRANEPDETTKPCDKEQDNRRSDLCAQWKAADAATNAANAAWWQFYAAIAGLVVGLLTLIAAGAAALYAKAAAKHTDEANRISMLALQPMLVFRPMDGRPPLEGLVREYRDWINNQTGGLNFVWKVHFANIGKSAAIITGGRIVCCISDVVPSPNADFRPNMGGHLPVMVTMINDLTENVIPSDDKSSLINITPFVSPPVPNEIGQRIRHSELRIWVVGFITYKDTFENNFITGFGYSLTHPGNHQRIADDSLNYYRKVE